MSPKECTRLDLSLEASILSELLHSWISPPSSSSSSPSSSSSSPSPPSSSSCAYNDVVGAYILACLALRKPRRYLCKVFKAPLVSNEISKATLLQVSRGLGDFEGLLDILDRAYLLRRLQACPNVKTMNFNDDISRIPVAVIFNHFQLVGIKHNENNFVNISIIQWALGKLPFTLMLDYIPTPMEVLKMQATGNRVLTVFTSHTNLSKEHVGRLHYMSGAKLHARNALEFCIHDMVRSLT